MGRNSRTILIIIAATKTTSETMNAFNPIISTIMASGLASDATTIFKTSGVNSSFASSIAITTPSTASSTVTESWQGKAKQHTTIALHYNTIGKSHTVVVSPEGMSSIVNGNVQTPTEELQYITTSLSVPDKQTSAGPTISSSSVNINVSSVYTSASIILTNRTPSSASSTHRNNFTKILTIFLYSRSYKSVTHI